MAASGSLILTPGHTHSPSPPPGKRLICKCSEDCSLENWVLSHLPCFSLHHRKRFTRQQHMLSVAAQQRTRWFPGQTSRAALSMASSPAPCWALGAPDTPPGACLGGDVGGAPVLKVDSVPVPFNGSEEGHVLWATGGGPCESTGGRGHREVLVQGWPLALVAKFLRGALPRGQQGGLLAHTPTRLRASPEATLAERFQPPWCSRSALTGRASIRTVRGPSHWISLWPLTYPWGAMSSFRAETGVHLVPREPGALPRHGLLASWYRCPRPIATRGLKRDGSAQLSLSPLGPCRVRSIIMLQEKAQDRERLLLKFIKIMKVTVGTLPRARHRSPCLPARPPAHPCPHPLSAALTEAEQLQLLPGHPLSAGLSPYPQAGVAEADLRGGRLGGQPGGQLWDARPGCGGTSSAPPCPSFLSLISSHWALRGLVLVSARVVTSRHILLPVPQNRAWVPASPSASCPRPGLLEGLLWVRAALGIGMYCEQARPVIGRSSSGQVLQGEGWGWGAEQACERGVWASLGVRQAP